MQVNIKRLILGEYKVIRITWKIKRQKLEVFKVIGIWRVKKRHINPGTAAVNS